MPLWVVYYPEGIFTEEADKKALVDDISLMYTEIGLPAFYVVVKFIQSPDGDFWVGGRKVTKDNVTVRIAIEHIAVNLEENDETYHRTTQRINKCLKAQVADKGYKWEYHVDETERRLWKVNGMNAPPFGSDEEKKWAVADQTLDWEGAWTAQKAPVRLG